MLVENSFYISSLLYGKLIYLGLLSPAYAAFFGLYLKKKEKIIGLVPLILNVYHGNGI